MRPPGSGPEAAAAQGYATKGLAPRLRVFRSNRRCGRRERGHSDFTFGRAGRLALSVTQQQVLERLAKVASPQGAALTDAKVLSDIAVNDGKVFFSINVDAAEARAWESVRTEAEKAVRAIPGVTTAMVALTAERKAGAAPAAAPHRQAQGVPHVSPNL